MTEEEIQPREQAPGEETQPQETALSEASPEDYRKRRESGEGAGEPDTSGAEKAEKEESPSGEGKQPEQKEKEKPKRKGGFQRRINELTRTNRELQERLTALEGKSSVEPEEKPAEKPKVSDFENYEEYVEALTDWKVENRSKADSLSRKQAAEQARAQESHKTRLTQWNERLTAARDKYEDYDSAADSDVVISQPMADAMMDSEVGAEILYFLGKNPSESERIAKLHPLAAFREIGKIEASLSKESVAPKQPVSKQPKPLTPVKPSGTTGKKPLSECSPEEYRRRREAGEGA